MKLVANADVREFVEKRGGVMYIWPRAIGCCRGRSYALDAATEPPEREFELVHAADGLQVHATLGLRRPDELHLELGRRGKLRAYWNGQAWIG